MSISVPPGAVSNQFSLSNLLAEGVGQYFTTQEAKKEKRKKEILDRMAQLISFHGKDVVGMPEFKNLYKEWSGQDWPSYEQVTPAVKGKRKAITGKRVMPRTAPAPGSVEETDVIARYRAGERAPEAPFGYKEYPQYGEEEFEVAPEKREMIPAPLGGRPAPAKTMMVTLPTGQQINLFDPDLPAGAVTAIISKMYEDAPDMVVVTGPDGKPAKVSRKTAEQMMINDIQAGRPTKHYYLDPDTGEVRVIETDGKSTLHVGSRRAKGRAVKSEEDKDREALEKRLKKVEDEMTRTGSQIAAARSASRTGKVEFDKLGRKLRALTIEWRTILDKLGRKPGSNAPVTEPAPTQRPPSKPTPRGPAFNLDEFYK